MSFNEQEDSPTSTSKIQLFLAMDIHQGKLSDFEAIAKQMVDASKKEPGTLCYSFFLSPDHKHCRLIEAYSDVSAITAHFKGPAVQQFVPQLLRVASLNLLEIYGDPGSEVTAMAAQFKPLTFRSWHGFERS